MALPLGAVQLTVVSCITTAMAIMATMLRLWSRYLQSHSLVIHDYPVLAGMFFTAGTVSVFLTAGFAAGLGVHSQELMATAPEKFTLQIKLYIPAQLLWAVANTCVKGSILSFYTHLFPDKTFTRWCHGVMLATSLFPALVLVETFGLCRPIQYTWDKTIDGVCTGEDSVYLIVGIVNTIIDACILVLPMPLVFRLQMTLKKLMGIAGMFSFGALICIISLLRAIWIQTWDQSDRTYNIVHGAIYFVLEPKLGVVNACLPTIKPAVIYLFSLRALDSTGSDAQVPYQPHKKVKGNITRDLERLNDEFALYETRVDTSSHAETNFGSCGSSSVQVDRVFSIAHDPGAVA